MTEFDNYNSIRKFFIGHSRAESKDMNFVSMPIIYYNLVGR